MPLADVQARFRELGRIRTGQKVPTGRGKMRPEKLARFRLTSPWQHLIEQSAEVFGGEARPWDNDGSPEFEVIVEVDSIPIVIPPGDVMEQWYELWTGGGCQRRCDGIRQVLVDRPCACPEDPIERGELAGSGKACKPTTRLRVMIPDVADVGIWRLESHGFHAAAELGGAVGLIEAATRSGALIPADLRLQAREGSRRPGQPAKKFFVPAISFRGTLGPVLDRLGILEEGATMPALLAGVEGRPALDGTPALPAGETRFDPAPPTEPANFGQTAPPPPPPPPARDDRLDAEEPPEPEAFDVADTKQEAAPLPPDPEAFAPPPVPPRDDHEPGDGGRSYTGPQMIAMRFDERGVKDRAERLRLVSWLVGRAIASGNDLDGPEVRMVLSVLNDDVAFDELVAEATSAPDSGAEAPESPSPGPAASPAASGPDPGSEPIRGELVDGPPRRRRRPAESATTPPTGPATPAPHGASGWRSFLADRGVKVAEVLREASRLARVGDVTAPSNLDEISDDLAGPLVEWVEDTAATREAGR